MDTVVKIYEAQTQSHIELPELSFGISAGFPSPALDFMDAAIDLNRELIAHPAATYYGRVQGDSMKNAGIDDGDLLIIDKSLLPADGKIAVCYLDGEFTLKRLRIKEKKMWLTAENEKYPPIEIKDGQSLTVWGIVTYVVKKPH